MQQEIEGIMYEGNVIILEQNVAHTGPKGELAFFIFIDPTSYIAEQLRKNYLKGCKTAAINIEGINITK